MTELLRKSCGSIPICWCWPRCAERSRRRRRKLPHGPHGSHIAHANSATKPTPHPVHVPDGDDIHPPQVILSFICEAFPVMFFRSR